MRYPLARQRRRAGRDEELQPFHQHAMVFGIPAGVESQDRERQSRINRTLGFLLVHAKHRARRPPLPHDAAR